MASGGERKLNLNFIRLLRRLVDSPIEKEQELQPQVVILFWQCTIVINHFQALYDCVPKLYPENY